MSINDQFRTLIEDVKVDAEEIGFYLSGCNIAADKPERLQEAEEADENVIQLMEDGEINFAVFMEFEMRDHAFSDHVLNPQKVKDDQEFKMIVPDSYEAFKSSQLDDLEDFD